MLSIEEKKEFCVIKNPRGKIIVDHQLNQCYYKIPYVSKSDEGLWTIEYAVEGINTLLKEYINITTYHGNFLKYFQKLIENLIFFACHR